MRARRRDGFDPAIHGFGFRNWSTREPTYPEHDHEEVAEEQVRRVVGQRWSEPARTAMSVEVLGLPNALLDAIGKQIYVSVNQQSATNGHCYGMVFAAQQYYENPATLPFDRAVASELTHPEEPVGESDAAPVSKEIDLYQLTQFLNIHSWIGRRSMVHPEWIRYETQIDRVTSVLDEFGTAGITLFNAGSRLAHQVLVYDYRRDSDVTRLLVYDPNYAASRYARAESPRTVEIDTSGDRPTVRRYNDTYDEFVFNRRDRVVAAQSAPVPSTLVERSGDRLRDAMFCLALFLVDSPDVSMTVVGPDDRPLRRDEATYMDRGAGAYSRMRYRYGFSPGTYRVRVVGDLATEYTLEALVSDHEAARLDATASRSIDAGEVHRYTAEIPETGSGSLDFDSGSPPWVTGVAGMGVGVGVAVGGYRYLRTQSGGGSAKSDDSVEDEL